MALTWRAISSDRLRRPGPVEKNGRAPRRSGSHEVTNTSGSDRSAASDAGASGMTALDESYSLDDSTRRRIDGITARSLFLRLAS